MYVFNEDEIYLKLVSYASEKCDVICVTKRFYKYEITPKIIDAILKESNDIETDVLLKYETIVLKYSEEYFNYWCNKLANDETVFDKEYVREFEKTIANRKKTEDHKKEVRCYYIRNALDWILYEYNTTKWLRKYKNRIIYKEEIEKGINYYLKINGTLKAEILSKQGFRDWTFPNSIEALSYYKNERCWLYTVLRICPRINYEDRKEYEYLKSIGVKFMEKHYRPISKQDVIVTPYLNS